MRGGQFSGLLFCAVRGYLHSDRVRVGVGVGVRVRVRVRVRVSGMLSPLNGTPIRKCALGARLAAAWCALDARLVCAWCALTLLPYDT